MRSFWEFVIDDAESDRNRPLFKLFQQLAIYTTILCFLLFFSTLKINGGWGSPTIFRIAP